MPSRLQFLDVNSNKNERFRLMTRGKVYLVGAGPGDPDLITRKALRLLAAADVVIYDRLIPRELLWEARPDAEVIDAGKAPTTQRLSQDAINQILVERATQGKTVLRLKGGDPLVFGRGGEEALVCHQHGIPFEIVPGISSAYAVPAYAGIPLTHRRLSSCFTVITGHEALGNAKPGAPECPSVNSVNYEALAKIGGTIVILMGVKQLPGISQRLMAQGLAGGTPAAIIEWGTLPRQRTVVGTLSTIAQLAREARIQPPAVTVLGEVVRLREGGAQWFDLLRIPRRSCDEGHRDFA